MTEIQLKYQANVETNRANLARENQARNELSETNRHNVATEGEAVRHNKVGEGLEAAKVKETGRHNRASEKISKDTLKETKRSNKAREKETHRSNKANEKETKRSNKAREKENSRSNKANESIKRSTASAQISKMQAETQQLEFYNDLRDKYPTIFTAQEVGKTSKGKGAEVASILELLGFDLGSFNFKDNKAREAQEKKEAQINKSLELWEKAYKQAGDAIGNIPFVKWVKQQAKDQTATWKRLQNEGSKPKSGKSSKTKSKKGK